MNCGSLGCSLFQKGCGKLCSLCWKNKTGNKKCKVPGCAGFKDCRKPCKIHWPICSEKGCHQNIWSATFCFDHSKKGTLPCTVCKKACCLKYQRRCPDHVVFCIVPDCLQITKTAEMRYCDTHSTCYVCQKRNANWRVPCRICLILSVFIHFRLSKDLRQLIIRKYL